jgi:hypothetical protein
MRPSTGVDTIFALQCALPRARVAARAVVSARDRLAYAVQCGATAFALAALARAGIALFPPWWAAGAATVVAATIALVRWSQTRVAPAGARRTALPRERNVGFGALGVVAAVVLARCLAGAASPPGPVADLELPLARGTYLVVNGGTDLLVNAHRASMLASQPRLRPWRGNGHALDLVAIDAFGLRAGGVHPVEPEAYLSFGRAVLAPCDGRVVRAVDGLPDMPVPERDRAHPAGNHVILESGDVHVVLAHFERGSLRVGVGDRVAVGQEIARVGNSGGSDEPHLHVHAQRPGRPGEPFAGDPVPMRFGGRFLVRGDRPVVR